MCQIRQKRSDRCRGIGWKVYIYHSKKPDRGTYESPYMKNHFLKTFGVTHIISPLEAGFNSVLEVLRANASYGVVGHYVFSKKGDAQKLYKHLANMKFYSEKTLVLAKVEWCYAIASGESSINAIETASSLRVNSIRVISHEIPK